MIRTGPSKSGGSGVVGRRLPAFLAQDPEDGNYVKLECVDLNWHGAAFHTEERPPVGRELLLFAAFGKKIEACWARVVSHADPGISVVFVRKSHAFRSALAAWAPPS